MGRFETIALDAPHTVPEVISQATLFRKMNRVMARVRHVEKRGTHPVGYKFVQATDVFRAVQEAMAEEGLCIFVETESVSAPWTVEVKGGPVRDVTLRITIGCGETGATFVSRYTATGQDPTTLASTKAATSALKSFLSKTFLIDSGEPDEDDTANTNGAATFRAPSKKTVSAATAEREAFKKAKEEESNQRYALTEEVRSLCLDARLAGADAAKVDTCEDWLQKVGPVASLDQIRAALAKVQTLVSSVS